MVLLFADWTTCAGAVHLTDTERADRWGGERWREKKGVKERERERP